MSSIKNLYIIIFKKFNKKLGAKSLVKNIVEPRHIYKKARLLNDSCTKGAITKIKSEPEKRHAVIPKAKCTVDVRKIGSNSKVVFKKKIPFNSVLFLDNPFTWLKGLYKNVYINGDEQINTKYKGLPRSLYDLPNSVSDAADENKKIVDPKSSTHVFGRAKSFPPSDTEDPPSVKNINVVTKDISCSTLDERSILATCLCVLPLKRSKLTFKDIQEQQINDQLKAIETHDSRLAEDFGFANCFQTFKTYTNDLNSLLVSKPQNTVPLTVLHVDVEDMKMNQISDPESSKQQAMAKILSLDNDDKIKLTLLTEEADDSQNRKSPGNLMIGNSKIIVSQQKSDCIEPSGKKCEVNFRSATRDYSFSPWGKKKPPEKDKRKGEVKNAENIIKQQQKPLPVTLQQQDKKKSDTEQQQQQYLQQQYQHQQFMQQQQKQQQQLQQQQQQQQQLQQQQLQQQQLQQQQLQQQQLQQQQLQQQQLQQQQLQQQQLQQQQQQQFICSLDSQQQWQMMSPMQYYWPMQAHNEEATMWQNYWQQYITDFENSTTAKGYEATQRAAFAQTWPASYVKAYSYNDACAQQPDPAAISEKRKSAKSGADSMVQLLHIPKVSKQNKQQEQINSFGGPASPAQTSAVVKQEKPVQELTNLYKQGTPAQPLVLAASFVPVVFKQLSNPVKSPQATYTPSVWSEPYEKTFDQQVDAQQQQGTVAAANATAYLDSNSNTFNQHTPEQLSQEAYWYMVEQKNEYLTQQQQWQQSPEQLKMDQPSAEQAESFESHKQSYEPQIYPQPQEYFTFGDCSTKSTEQAFNLPSIYSQAFSQQQTLENTSCEPKKLLENFQQTSPQQSHLEYGNSQENSPHNKEENGEYGLPKPLREWQKPSAKKSKLIKGDSSAYDGSKAALKGTLVLRPTKIEKPAKTMMMATSSSIENGSKHICPNATKPTATISEATSKTRPHSGERNENQLIKSSVNLPNVWKATKLFRDIINKKVDSFKTQQKNPMQNSKELETKPEHFAITKNMCMVKELLMKNWQKKSCQKNSLKQDFKNSLSTSKQETMNADNWMKTGNVATTARKNTTLEAENSKKVPNVLEKTTVSDAMLGQQQQFATLDKVISEQKLTPVQSKHELCSMLDPRTDLYRIKNTRSINIPELHTTNDVHVGPEHISGLIEKVEKHFLCWKEQYFEKSTAMQNSKNISIVKQFEETLEQMKRIVPTIDNPETVLPISLTGNGEDKKNVICANQILNHERVAVAEENEKPKEIVRREDKSDDMELLLKKDGLVDGKSKTNTKKAGIRTNDTLLLPEQLKDFSNIAKRKLHILNVKNQDFEEMCRHSSLLMNCRIVLDGSERNEPNTTLHAKVYDFNKKKRDGLIFAPLPRNKK